MAEITSKVKLSYLKNGAWKSFSAKIQSSIDGLKIQTSNSAYYLQYRTWNQGKTAFYPYVKSTVNDYAGMDGRPVQLLQIQALKSDGTRAGFRHCGDVPHLYGWKMAPLGKQRRPQMDGERAEKI